MILYKLDHAYNASLKFVCSTPFWEKKKKSGISFHFSKYGTIIIFIDTEYSIIECSIIYVTKP